MLCRVGAGRPLGQPRAHGWSGIACPDDCPDTGANGLQQCIDGLVAGSTIVLTHQIIGEFASIMKSLTLRASSRSLQPVLEEVFIGGGGC